jgi:ribonuclease HI
MSVTIFTDGGCRGNPGPSSAGVYVPSMGLKLGFPLPEGTNNEAEYRALIHALQVATRLGLPQIEILSDSELLVKQMTGVYGVRSEKILPLWEKATLLAAYSSYHTVTYTHVFREDNKVADKVCNLTLDAMAFGYKGAGIRWGDLDSPEQQIEQLLDTTFLT